MYGRFQLYCDPTRGDEYAPPSTQRNRHTPPNPGANGDAIHDG